ncbi:hypothetical protein [Novosphingobium sp. AAP1]|uniref:phosphorylase family protein n=1 Tax=Novosphingobium sp. AAP1 TaxID=1523413 RepID=UPI0006B9D6AD|nr:hypothetical protein [Novosphingobium sp. AAP1]
MKVLVVDDNAAKVAKILNCIDGVAGVARDDCDVAFTMIEARDRLSQNNYDLMILDFVMPFRAGDSPQTESTVHLLTELRDRKRLRKPAHIIGLTAYQEGVDALQPIFSQQTWTIVRYSEAETDWSDQIKAGLAWIASAAQKPEERTFSIDACIITALPYPEYDAVLRNGWTWGPAEPLDDTAFIRYGEFICAGSTYKVASAHSPKMGMIPASLLSAKLIQKLRPRILAIAGICAGIKGRGNYGDPIVADPCWDWQSGKHIVKDGAQEFEIRPDPLPIMQEVRVRWEQLKGDRQFWSDLRAEWPDAPDTELRLRLGPSVSGSSVLADAAIVERIKAQHGGVVSVEMEAYGVFSATAAAPRPRPLTFSCKSVCDLADEKKDDRWQTYAAFTSARSVTAYLERYMSELADLLG